jgi:hypothetical protein
MITGTMTGVSLSLIFVVCALGIVLSALMSRRNCALIVAVGGTASSVLMMLAAGAVLVSGKIFEASLWLLQGFGSFSVRLDSLSLQFFSSQQVWCICQRRSLCGRFPVIALGTPRWYAALG